MEHILSVSSSGQYFTDTLLQNIKDGNEAGVSSILQGTNPSQLTDSSGATLLHVAARYDNAWLARYLIGLGAAVDAQNHQQETPLMFAVRNDHLEVVKVLLEAEADMYLPDKVGQCALGRAFLNGDTNSDSIEKAFKGRITCESLNRSMYVNTRLFHLNCPLVEFLDMKNSNITRILLEKGSPVNARNTINGETALHVAVGMLDPENVKLLLEYGANVNMKDSDGSTPLTYLNDFEDQIKALAVLKTLLAAGATLIDYDHDEIFASSILSYGNKEIIRELLKYKIDLHFKDEAGHTVINYLVYNHNPDVLRELRGFYFDTQICPMNLKLTLLHCAAIYGNSTSIDVLLDRGADINAECHEGLTPLHTVITNGIFEERLDGYVNCIEMLLVRGADPRIFTEKNHQHLMARFNGPIPDILVKIMKPILINLSALESSNQDIGEAMRSLILSVSQFKTAFNSKKIELEEIKQIKLGKLVTLLDFLVATKEDVSWYARCRSFGSISFCAVNLSNLDPFYQYKLKENFKIFSSLTDERKLSTLAIDTVFLKLFGISVNNVAEKIVEYLEDREVRKFLHSICS